MSLLYADSVRDNKDFDILCLGQTLHGGSGGMASGNLLPVPQPLEIHDSQAADKWKRFKRAWASYALATGLDEKAEKVQVQSIALAFEFCVWWWRTSELW